MQNKKNKIIIIVAICCGMQLQGYNSESSEHASDYLAKIAQLTSMTRRKASKKEKKNSDYNYSGNAASRKRDNRKVKTDAEEFPQPVQPSAASRYNETIEFIYNDAYNMAYNLALLRVSSMYTKKIYLLAVEELKKTNLIRTIKNNDLSQTEFYSYYNTIFNICIDKFSNECSNAAVLYTAGFTNLKTIVTEIVIHHAVYKAFIDTLFHTRRTT